MQEPLNIEKLKSNLANRLEALFSMYKLTIDKTHGNFVVDTEKYVLKAIISESEISYTLDIKATVNNLRLGISASADYSPYIGDPALERVALAVYKELEVLLGTMRNNEIYCGKGDGRSAYLAWRSSEGYLLKKYKRTFLGGLKIREEVVTKGIVEKLNMEHI